MAAIPVKYALDQIEKKLNLAEEDRRTYGDAIAALDLEAAQHWMVLVELYHADHPGAITGDDFARADALRSRLVRLKSKART